MTIIMLLIVLAVITLPSIVWLYALADVTINNGGNQQEIN